MTNVPVVRTNAESLADKCRGRAFMKVPCYLEEIASLEDRYAGQYLRWLPNRQFDGQVSFLNSRAQTVPPITPLPGARYGLTTEEVDRPA
jgi:hypothetical protein